MVQAHRIAPDDKCKVWEVKVQQDKPEAAQALDLLTRAARQVQPILRRHAWQVRKGLCCGCGDAESCSEILIRLRRPGDDLSFHPYESIIGTVLHEITHITHAKHDQGFYSLLERLTKECEELVDQGIQGTGTGFDAASSGRLGGRGPVAVHNPAPHKLREVALKAAEKRARKQMVMSPGPQRLGGSMAIMGLTPAQAAAAAAEQRARDNVWCPSELADRASDSGTVLDSLHAREVGEQQPAAKEEAQQQQVHAVDTEAAPEIKHRGPWRMNRMAAAEAALRPPHRSGIKRPPSDVIDLT